MLVCFFFVFGPRITCCMSSAISPNPTRNRQQRLPPAAQASPSRLALVCPGPAALACAWPLQTCSAGWCSARVTGAGLVRICGGCVPCLCVSASASVTWPREAKKNNVRPGATGLLIGIECFRVRDKLWMYLTSFVITRTSIELAVVQKKLPNYVVV
jgi:hypothetical protein